MSVPDHADISSGQHDVAWARGGDYTGPSRRTGLLTSAARRSASVFKMRDGSRHRSIDVRTKLTPAFCQKARAEEDAERSVYWDTDLPGFGLVVTSSGHRSFVVQYRAGRRSRRMTVDGVLGLAALASAPSSCSAKSPATVTRCKSAAPPPRVRSSSRRRYTHPPRHRREWSREMRRGRRRHRHFNLRLSAGLPQPQSRS